MVNEGTHLHTTLVTVVTNYEAINKIYCSMQGDGFKANHVAVSNC